MTTSKKPFDLDELLCRIEKVFRHIYPKNQKVRISDYCYFDPLTRTLYENDTPVKLPRKVILLLELFIANSGKIVTKEQIIDNLWSAGDTFSEGAIRVYVNRLKKYMRKEQLVSIKGIGYRFKI